MRLTKALLLFSISLSNFSLGQLFAQNNQYVDSIDPILTAEQINYINSLDSLTVCSVAQAVGSMVSIDLVSLITKKTGIKVVASKPISWQEGIDGLADGFCDILPWATETQSRRAAMNFTRPYARLVRVLVTRIEQPYIGNIEQHLDKSYVTEKNNHVATLLKQKYPALKTLNVEHTKRGLELVAENKVFASIASLYSVGNLFNKPAALELKIAGQLPPEFDDIVSLATRKNDLVLSQILDKAILTTSQRDISNFLHESALYVYRNETVYRKYWLVGVSMLVVVVALLWWIRYLRNLNLRLARIQTKLRQKSRELEKISITDALTNTFNRHKLDSEINKEITRAKRYSNHLSLIMLDIDLFKGINDQFGHIQGDKTLVEFAQILKANIRDNDVLGRWGGEEFMIICTGIDAKAAQQAANKLREIIQQNDFSPVDKITASFGVTEWKTSDSKESFVLRADKALYQSKRDGRNQVNVEL
jgi:diguanylate cyclase (GGDEF)-like protein